MWRHNLLRMLAQDRPASSVAKWEHVLSVITGLLLFCLSRELLLHTRLFITSIAGCIWEGQMASLRHREGSLAHLGLSCVACWGSAQSLVEHPEHFSSAQEPFYCRVKLLPPCTWPRGPSAETSFSPPWPGIVLLHSQASRPPGCEKRFTAESSFSPACEFRNHQIIRFCEKHTMLLFEINVKLRKG